MTYSIKKLIELSMTTGMELIDNSTNHIDDKYVVCIKKNNTKQNSQEI